jgi:hypothetical protein
MEPDRSVTAADKALPYLPGEETCTSSGSRNGTGQLMKISLSSEEDRTQDRRASTATK